MLWPVTFKLLSLKCMVYATAQENRSTTYSDKPPADSARFFAFSEAFVKLNATNIYFATFSLLFCLIARCAT